MRTLVLYYSRTGTTRLAAEAVAEAVGAELSEIQAPRYRGAILGYARAGYDSLKRKVPPITTSNAAGAEYEQLVLATPVWTSYPATPIRAFLLTEPPLPNQVALLLTYGGHSPAEKAFDELETLIRRKVRTKLALRADEILAGNATDQLATFCKSIQDPAGE